MKWTEEKTRRKRKWKKKNAWRKKKSE